MYVDICSGIKLSRAERRIVVEKESISPEDELALKFASALEKFGVEYAVVAGYIAILFGRARRSDDVDFIAKQVSEEDFLLLCFSLKEDFEILQCSVEDPASVRRAYREYLLKGYALRFALREALIPNVEFKFARTELQKYAIDHAYQVILVNRGAIRIAPLELQIAYKLKLGSEKDISDAVFLYALFEEALSEEELERWARELRVDLSPLKS